MMNNIQDIYFERIGNYQREIKKLNKYSVFLSILKFIPIVTALFFLFKIKLAWPVWVFLLAVLVSIFIIHEKTIGKQKRLKLLCKINEDELQYLDNKFPLPDSGVGFFDEEHRYAEDIDIFCERGIFYYVNRAGTIIAKKFLADWLKEDSSIDEIKNRQEAVIELSPQLDFRQDIQASGAHIDDPVNTINAVSNLLSLLNESFFILGKKIFIVYFHIIPLLTMAAVAAIFLGVPWGIALLFASIQMIVNNAMGKRVIRVYRHTDKNCKILKAYAEIMEKIERQSFAAAELKKLQDELLVKGKAASACIKRLANLAAMFDLRLSGIFYFILNNTLSWDFHCIYRIEKLVNDIKAEMPVWLNAAGKVEALCSFANLYFNHPDWALPGFVEEGFKLEADEIGHPLIPKNERINNDIKLTGSGRIMIVTGSNMAGKSTFLRTIGVNLALAYAGAPVCAGRFVVSPLKLYSSMKVSDSLDKKLSLFYTELQHLKKILDGVERGEPIFFIIDEMLKGTNTKDRQQGAIALIKQLLRHNAPGLIATHDLELSRLADEYPQDIINYHFDGYIQDDRLLFDYKLKQGVCRSFNALTLMRKIGIQV